MASRRFAVALLVVAARTASAQEPVPETLAPSPSEPAPAPPPPPVEAPVAAAPDLPLPAPPVPPTAPPGVNAVAPPAAKQPAPSLALPFAYSLAFEVGYAQTADTAQLYGNGYGKVFVLGYRRFELRFLESYDLADRSGMFDADHGHAQLGIMSLGYRWHLPIGGFALRPLLGVAWVRRPSLRIDPDDLFEDYAVSSQHGLAAMLGGGAMIRFGEHLAISADLRLYPTYWSGIDGIRANYQNGMVTVDPLMSSPGGIPRTFTVALTLGM